MPNRVVRGVLILVGPVVAPHEACYDNHDDEENEAEDDAHCNNLWLAHGRRGVMLTK